jgi:general secretion pathway protein A
MWKMSFPSFQSFQGLCARNSHGGKLDAAGFLLIDSSYRPIYADPESIKILGYPNSVAAPESLDGVLTQKILSFLPREFLGSQVPFVTQFQSGRRRYLCRAFVLEDHWNDSVRETRIALLLERGLPGPPAESKYKKLGGMTEDPFGFSPDSRFYHFSRAHKEVLSSLRSLVRDRSGTGVLLGQAGMGKTALLNYMTEKLRSESDVAVFSGSFENRGELVRGLMGILGINGLKRDLVENLEHLRNWLVARNREGRTVAVVCDDAQDLSFETIEDLCTLTDLECAPQKLIQIIFAGRQGLLEKLSGPRLEPVSRKINVFCRLAPLDEAEVRSYIQHRLRIAGCTRQVFSHEALSSIAVYSRGIPLNINMLCRHSMSLAATINLQVVDDRIVADSAYDLVLRAQPANIWDSTSGGLSQETRRPAGLLRDRRGLRLVKPEK